MNSFIKNEYRERIKMAEKVLKYEECVNLIESIDLGNDLHKCFSSDQFYLSLKFNDSKDFQEKIKILRNIGIKQIKKMYRCVDGDKIITCDFKGLRLCIIVNLSNNSKTCKKVKVGEKIEPIYEIVCEGGVK